MTSDMHLDGKKILVGITGSIAAYKIPFLIRLLVKAGAEVKVVMTPSAADFVTPLTLSTLTHSPVLTIPFSSVDGLWYSHVDWGNWADLYLIAPASANTLAKMASGLTDNLLTAIYLAAKCPVLFAPAMDVDMYMHPATQDNIARLQSFGNIQIAPQIGELASGLTGAGRLEEPEAILQILINHFNQTASLKGKNILITAGPTQEAIDPVRYIGNHSSGKMGFALAEEACRRGGHVTLIAGPTTLETHAPGIERVDVITAGQMALACEANSGKADIIIMAAAVADYKPVMSADQKIKKSDKALTIELEPTSDILKSLGERKKNQQFIAGFALETENGEQNALKKLHDKNLDLIVLNSPSHEGTGFGFDTNKITIFVKSGQKLEFTLKSKREAASDILDTIVSCIPRQKPV